jgi:hypothetical protein
VNFKNLRTLEENNKMTILSIFGSDVFLGFLANLCVEHPERYSFPFDCIEKTIGFVNIHFRSMMQDKFLKSHVMDQEMIKAFQKKSDETHIWNWQCGWPGADQRWRELHDHMVGEIGYDDLIGASNMMKSVKGEDTFEDGVMESGHRIFLDGTNVKSTIHGFQMADPHKEWAFWKFDYGEWKNKQVYGTEHPPKYPMDKYEVPTWSIVGTGDMDMTVGQIEKHRSMVSPDCKWEIIELEDYRLLRFFWPVDPTPFFEVLDKIMIENTLS